MKKKIYVLMVSRYFPANHPRAEQPTNFENLIPFSIMNLEKQPRVCGNYRIKIHTCRANYELWKKRIQKVQEGKAVLSLRYWSGSPYNYKRDGSKQIEFYRLDHKDGIGIQKLEFGGYKQGVYSFYIPIIDGNKHSGERLAHNDGLLFYEFREWFKSYDLSKQLAVIHFTNFRYSNKFQTEKK